MSAPKLAAGNRGHYWTRSIGAIVIQEAESRGEYTWADRYLAPARYADGTLKEVVHIEHSIKVMTRINREAIRDWTKTYQLRLQQASGSQPQTEGVIDAPMSQTQNDDPSDGTSPTQATYHNPSSPTLILETQATSPAAVVFTHNTAMSDHHSIFQQQSIYASRNPFAEHHSSLSSIPGHANPVEPPLSTKTINSGCDKSTLITSSILHIVQDRPQQTLITQNSFSNQPSNSGEYHVVSHAASLLANSYINYDSSTAARTDEIDYNIPEYNRLGYKSPYGENPGWD